MLVGIALGWAAPAVTVDSEDWPEAARVALSEAAAACAPPVIEGAFTATVSGTAPDRVVEVSAADEAVEAIAPCLRDTIAKHPAVAAGDADAFATVTLGLDPALLAAVTLPAAPTFVTFDGAPDPDPAATGSALSRAIARCVPGRAFSGRIELYDPFGDPKQASTFWRPAPRTPDGEAIVACAKAWLWQEASVDLKVRRSEVIEVRTPTAPARGPVTVSPTAEVTPPAVLARLQDAAEQCAAIAPLTAPHVRSFQPEGHNLLGITTSMGEGLAMPPEGFEACLQLLPSDFPAKSALTFTIGPQRP